MKLGVTLESIAQDLIYAGRMLRKNPAFAAASIATLALGIGANSAIFGVVYAALLKPLPYLDAGRLCAIHMRVPQFEKRIPTMPVRPRDFVEWRREDTPFSGLALFRATTLNLTGEGEPERLGAVRVSSNLFSLLGVQPERGRTFQPEEDQPARNYEVILSHDFWVTRFGADPAILGRGIPLDGRMYRVIGILPANFIFPTGAQFHPLLPLPQQIDIWTPIALSEEEISTTGNLDYGLIGRLKPGVTVQQARERMDALSEPLAKRDFTTFRLDLFTQVIPLRDIFERDVRGGLILLLSATGILLLIACMNLANLSMARLSGRINEFATRTALGANRSRLVRQALTEAGLISFLGGVLALAVAKWGTDLMIWLGPADMPALHQTVINFPVLVFTAIVALLTPLFFGLLPALGSRSVNLHEHLKAGSRSSTEDSHRNRLRGALIIYEVALSTALLTAGGLLLHSFVNVTNVDKGFGVQRILSVNLLLPPSSYSSNPQKVVFFQHLLERLRAVPGVIQVGAVTDLPLTNESRNKLTHLESDTTTRVDRPVAADRTVTPGYFSAMQIPLLAGRFFHEDEPIAAVIISQSLAKALWPTRQIPDDIGLRIRQTGARGPLITIVGIVGDVSTTSLDRRAMPQSYRPFSQNPASEMSLVIRVSGDAASLGPAIRAAVWEVDPNLPVPAMRSMREIVSQSMALRRFQMSLILALAIVALLLTLVGVYGVVNYSVLRRRTEIGLRMALGAQAADIFRAVLAKGLSPVFIGLALGVAGAVAAATALRSFLFGVGPLDPIALAGVVGVLLLAAALACYLPARRASRLDPITALREE